MMLRILIAFAVLCYSASGTRSETGTIRDCPFAKRARESKGHTAVKPAYPQSREDPDPEVTTPSGCTCISDCDNGWCYTADECGEYSWSFFGYWDTCIYPDVTTPNDCTCTTRCSATVDGGNFKYDWCSTADDCGESSAVHGDWDKCLYVDSTNPVVDNALGWETKQEEMWTLITANNSSAPYGSPLSVLTSSVKTTFEDEWDVMPVGRTKAIHGVGAVCQFVVNITNSPFTGILENGSAHGLIRLGSALDISSEAGVIPGGGVKFFRSGMRSANFVILNQLGPMADNNYNFFAVPLRNHIPEETTWGQLPLVKKFCQASKCPTKVGLSDVCKYNQEGNEVGEVVFPFMVTFEPTEEVQFNNMASEVNDFMAQFDDIPIGAKLYTLKGHEYPGDTNGRVLGQVVTTDKCVSSYFGDAHLFFKHQRVEDDTELMNNPTWTEAYEAKCTNVC